MQGPPPQIKPKDLDDYLEQLSKGVFQAGISWRVVDAKWPGIKAAFKDFDTERVARMSDRDIDKLAQDPQMIRGSQKTERSDRPETEFVDEHAADGCTRDDAEARERRRKREERPASFRDLLGEQRGVRGKARPDHGGEREIQDRRDQKRERQIGLEGEDGPGDEHAAAHHPLVPDPRPEAATELAPDEHAEALRQGERRRDTFRPAEGRLEEDDDVRGPGEPVEGAEQCRPDGTERTSIRHDRPVELADA